MVSELKSSFMVMGAPVAGRELVERRSSHGSGCPPSGAESAAHVAAEPAPLAGQSTEGDAHAQHA